MRRATTDYNSHGGAESSPGSDPPTFTPEQITAATTQHTRTNHSLFAFSKKVATATSGDKTLTKKIKVLYDSKTNNKNRFAALEEVLDTIQDVDVPLFYRENIETIFEVLSNVFVRQITKIKQKSNPSITSKEVTTLLKTLPILRQIFIHLSNRIQQGWEEDTLVMFFSQLLHYGNHPKLRKEGFELLLTWLSVLRQPSEGPLWLYRNAIPLDVYSFDRLHDTPHLFDPSKSGYIFMDQELIHLDDRTPLVPNPQPPSYLDSNELFQALLTNLAQLAYIVSGSGLPSELELTQDEAKGTIFPPEDYLLGLSMDSANASLKFMFTLFQKYYLAKLFSDQGREILSPVAKQEFVGFEKCPPSLAHVFMKFLVQNCLDDESKLLGINQQLASRIQPSPVCPILKKAFFGTSLSRSFINELIRQVLSFAPYGFSSTCMESVRSAILIIGTWFLSKDQERPVFLRNSSDADEVANQSSMFNDYAQMYLEMLHSMITWETSYSSTDRPPSLYTSSPELLTETNIRPTSLPLKTSLSDFTELQFLCYQEVFLIYQMVITDPQAIFSVSCKEFICQSLLEMNEAFVHIISSPPASLHYAGTGKFEIKSKYLHDSLSNLYETLFFAWTVSKVNSQELWLLFQKSMVRSNMLTPLIDLWTLTLKRFTHVLSAKLYDVETDPNSTELDELIAFGLKRHRKNGQKPSASKNSHARFNLAATSDSTHSHSHSDKPSISEHQSNPNGPSSFRRGYSFYRKPSAKSNSPFVPSDSRNASTISLISSANQGFSLLSDYYQHASQPFLRSSCSSTHSGSHSTATGPSPSQNVALASSSITDTHPIDEKNSGHLDLASTQNRKGSPGVLSHSFKQSVLSVIDYTSVIWTSQEVTYIWRNVLCCLGNINNFKHPGHQELALRCVIDVYDSMQNVRSFRAPDGPTVPCAYEMATWIIHAAEMASPFDNGRIMAYEWLCRVLGFRRSHEQIITTYGTSFYRLMLKGWSQMEEKVLEIIINHGTYVFSRDLTGANILAPVAISAVVNLFLENKKTYTKENEQLHRNAIFVLASLIHLPHQYKGLSLPVISYQQLSQGETGSTMSVEDTKVQIQTILLFLINEDDWSSHIENFPGFFGMIICALCVQVTHELIWQPSSNQVFIQKGMTAILDQLYSNNYILANVAIDCVSSFATVASSFYTLDPKGVSGILEDIVGALNVHLNLYTSTSSPENRYVLTRLFACLLEWLMVIPQHLLSDPHLEKLVLGTLDRGINGGIVSEGDRNNNDPFHFAIKDAAQMVLMHLINHFGQEEYLSDRSSLSTNFTEPDSDSDSGCQFLGFNGTTIFTLYPPGDQENTCIVVRNPLGKFAWDIGCSNDHMTATFSTPSPRALEWSCPIQDSSPVVPKENEPVLQMKFETFPEANPDDPALQQVDMLASALDFLEKEFEQAGMPEWIQTDAHQPDDAFEPLDLPTETSSPPELITKVPELDYDTVTEQPGVNRLFLDNLKIATFHNFQSGQFVSMHGGDSFFRDLKALDRKQSRETIKIGLIYVKDGQVSDSSILCNQSTSARYQAFIESIGWVVDLATHKGYTGGLEKNGANGTTSIYYSSPTLEIMFHDITRMPNDPEDPQQVKKKRHIGNDPVHIVWNESRCDYSPYTIGGDFGNVQIVIHPLLNDMFDVRIFRDNQAGSFGPLLNGMVLSKQVLPNLVRATAVNAYRSILCNSLGYHHNALNASISRAREIETMIRKHKSTTTPFEDIMASIYDLSPRPTAVPHHP